MRDPFYIIPWNNYSLPNKFIICIRVMRNGIEKDFHLKNVDLENAHDMIASLRKTYKNNMTDAEFLDWMFLVKD